MSNYPLMTWLILGILGFLILTFVALVRLILLVDLIRRDYRTGQEELKRILLGNSSELLAALANAFELLKEAPLDHGEEPPIPGPSRKGRH